jgi:hypothetical protein
MRKRAHERDPSQEVVRETFDYDPTDPAYPMCRRAAIRKGRPRSGSPSTAYTKMSIGDQLYVVQRLVWIWHNGAIPEGCEIDHIDRNKKNNVIGNLRVSTKADNRRNRATYGRAGFHGVTANGTGWAAVFRNENGVSIRCGTYPTPIEAARMYDRAINTYFGPNHPYPTNASEGLISLEA